MTPEDLVARAREARGNAYARYSNFHVGAALLTSDGRVFTGGNVENATFGLTVCAERSAVLAAVQGGARDFAAIAVASPTGASPCGLCRQTLYEFADDLPIHLAGPDGPFRTVRLAALFPEGFGPRDLP